MPSEDFPTVGSMLDAIDEDSGQFAALEDLRDDAVRRAVREMMLERTRTLLDALEAGYDGVDFVPYAATQDHELDPSNPVKLTEQARPWRGAPPDPADYPDHVREVNRVDFGAHDRETIRERLTEELECLEAEDG